MKEYIEYYHNNGMMPDWVYYQVNGKDIYENYREQKNKAKEKLSISFNQKLLENQIESQLETILSNIINKLNKDL